MLLLHIFLYFQQEDLGLLVTAGYMVLPVLLLYRSLRPQLVNSGGHKLEEQKGKDRSAVWNLGRERNNVITLNKKKITKMKICF